MGGSLIGCAPPHFKLEAALLKHPKLGSIVRSLGIEVNDALEISKQMEI